ncbi:MAG: ABC transporter substrate-binding protein [Velocimicrobium sp.]
MENKKFRVILIVGICSFLACGVLWSLHLILKNGKNEEEREDKYTKLVIAYSTQAAGTKEQREVEEAVNKIVKEKLHIELEFRVYSQNYASNINRMLAGQEQLDLAFSYKSMYENYVMNQQIYQLDSLLKNYGQGILNTVGQKIIDTCKINDKLYGLPNNRDYAVGWDAYILQKDLLDKYQIDATTILTEQELEQVFDVIKKGEPGITIVASTGGNMLSNLYFSLESIGVHMKEGQSEKVSNLFETKEYKRALKRIRRWFLNGYLDENVLEQTQSVQKRMKEGTLFAYEYRAKPGVEQQESVACQRKVVCVQLGKNIVANNEPASMQWVITKNSISPEKSMQLLNLLYTNADLMNLLSYGIAGKHYVYTKDGHITYPKGKNSNPFIETAWEMPNQFITYIWEGNPLSLWTDIRAFNEEAIYGCDFGFNFDTSTVATEYITLQEIYNRYSYILGNGLVDPEEGLEKMNKEMKSNFIDDVITQEQRQFDEWKIDSK